MTEGFRVKIKLSDGTEFEGEGPEKFLLDLADRLLGPKDRKTPHAPSGKPPVADEKQGQTSDIKSVVDPALKPIHDRVFSLDKDGGVSLRALPRTQDREADTMVLLLYGYQTLKGEHAVTGGQLKRAARQSGVPVERVDRILAPYESLVTTAGQKRGRRYGLNNQGAKKAEELLTQIMG